MREIEQLVQRLDQFETELTQVKDALGKTETARDKYHQLYLETLERCRKLERGLLGQKAERLSSDDAQLSLAMLDMLLNSEQQSEEPPPKEIKPHTRRAPTG